MEGGGPAKLEPNDRRTLNFSSMAFTSLFSDRLAWTTE
jgi:hypothetical protein